MRVEYIARDGRRFETLKECELHEKCRFIAEREEVVAKINRYKHYTLPKAHSTYLQSRNATLENCGLLVTKAGEHGSITFGLYGIATLRA